MAWEIQPGSKTEKPPAGNHLAVLVGLFDMGEQWQEPFDKTKTGYYQHRAYFVWELVGEAIEGTNKNHVIGIDLTMSVDDRSKLYKWVLARTGRPPAVPFNPISELGQSCFLNVVEKNGYPKVEGVAAVPKGVPVPPATYPVTAVSLEEFQNGKTIPDWCPWFYGSPLADHIRACREIGAEKPEPRGSQAGGSAPAKTFPNSPTIQNPGSGPSAADPAARWDARDEAGSTMANKTSAEVQALINEAKIGANRLKVKPAGAPGAAAKTADQFGFINGDVIPW